MLRRFAQIVLLLALCAPAPFGVTAQDGGAWRVESIVPLSELMPRATMWALPAPDASRVAWVYSEDTQVACEFVFASATEECFALPDEVGVGFQPGSLPPLVWAPDSQRLAIAGNPLQFFVDNDLTVADFAAQTATVLAPDETTGSLPIGKPGEAIIDVQPAWSPDGTRIAVERTLWSDRSNRIGRIAIVDATTGEEISSLEQPVLSSDGYNFGVTMALAWSPDGESIVWGRYAPNAPAHQNGVWLIGTDEAEQIISQADIQPLMGATEAGASAIIGFVWSPDGTAALVWVNNPYIATQRVLLYDAVTGTLGALPRPVEVADSRTDFGAAWSPDGSAIIVVSMVEETDAARTLVEDAQSQLSTGLWLVDRAAGMSALLGYVPGIPIRWTLGAWNADGDVVLSGYRLRLAQN